MKLDDLKPIAPNATDITLIPAGVGVAIAQVVTDVINPILTCLVIITTLVWTIYRIKSLRQQIRLKEKESDS